MKIFPKLMTLAGVLLVAAITLAAPAMAQVQGGARWGGGKGAAYGRGPGNPSCPNYPGYQNRGQYRPNNPGWNCPRWGTSQTPATPQTQPPAPQSGK